jgi:protein-S-isoprenylcysteine O-methyltransferase Ste14
MTTETIINAIANSTLAFSALGLLIHIFGDPDNSVWNNRVKAYLAKVGLSVTICGAIANVMTLSSPPHSEVVLNCGLSITFFWLSWWQWEMFKEMQTKSKKPRAVRKKVGKPRAGKTNKTV